MACLHVFLFVSCSDVLADKQDVQKTQTVMDKVNGSLQKMLATQDGCQLGVVIGMSIACVISVILLITGFIL